jgi:hypothetical protein
LKKTNKQNSGEKTMKKLVMALVFSLLLNPMVYAQPAGEQAAPEGAEAFSPAKRYFCPMDGFESDKPGKCEKCGMELVEKPSAEEAEHEHHEHNH